MCATYAEVVWSIIFGGLIKHASRATILGFGLFRLTVDLNEDPERGKTRPNENASILFWVPLWWTLIFFYEISDRSVRWSRCYISASTPSPVVAVGLVGALPAPRSAAHAFSQFKGRLDLLIVLHHYGIAKQLQKGGVHLKIEGNVQQWCAEIDAAMRRRHEGFLVRFLVAEIVVWV